MKAVRCSFQELILKMICIAFEKHETEKDKKKKNKLFEPLSKQS